jgi:hypothetical protein
MPGSVERDEGLGPPGGRRHRDWLERRTLLACNRRQLVDHLCLACDHGLLSAYSRRGVPTTGVMVIACVPPRNAGTGRGAGLLFVILFSSRFHLMALMVLAPRRRR